MQSIVAPMTRPMDGLTVTAEAITVTETYCLAHLSGGISLPIELLNCFPTNPEQTAYSRRERELINNSIDRLQQASEPIIVTIPAPKSAGEWFRHLQESRSLKPAIIWTSETTTINDELVNLRPRWSDAILVVNDSIEFRARRKDPPQPLNLIAPLSESLGGAEEALRPQPGLTLPIQSIVGISPRAAAADQWVVQIEGGTEMTVALVDCYCPSIKTNHGHMAYEEAWNEIDRHEVMAITVPEPFVSEGYFTSLVPNATLAGWVWLGNHLLLNRYLVNQGYATPVQKNVQKFPR